MPAPMPAPKLWSAIKNAMALMTVLKIVLSPDPALTLEAAETWAMAMLILAAETAGLMTVLTTAKNPAKAIAFLYAKKNTPSVPVSMFSVKAGATAILNAFWEVQTNACLILKVLQPAPKILALATRAMQTFA